MKFHGRVLAAILLAMLAAAAVFFVVVPAEVARQKNPLAVPPPYPVSAAAASLHRQLFIADLRRLLAGGAGGQALTGSLLAIEGAQSLEGGLHRRGYRKAHGGKVARVLQAVLPAG
jgi:hypothetical protein